MPRGDQTGPMGMGPMTGRAAGFCAGYQTPGFSNNAPGRVMAMGFCRRGNFGGRGGFGFRNRFNATGLPGRLRVNPGGMPGAAPDVQSETEALSAQAEYLQAELNAIKKRLEALTGQSEK